MKIKRELNNVKHEAFGKVKIRKGRKERRLEDLMLMSWKMIKKPMKI